VVARDDTERTLQMVATLVAGVTPALEESNCAVAAAAPARPQGDVGFRGWQWLLLNSSGKVDRARAARAGRAARVESALRWPRVTNAAGSWPGVGGGVGCERVRGR